MAAQKAKVKKDMMNFKVGDKVKVNTPGMRLHRQVGEIQDYIDVVENKHFGDYWVNFGGPMDAPFFENQLEVIDKEKIND